MLARDPKKNDRWTIFRANEESSGPFTGYELRMALREGQAALDDFVSRDSSNVRQKIRDIDDIFHDQTLARVPTTGSKKVSEFNLLAPKEVKNPVSQAFKPLEAPSTQVSPPAPFKREFLAPKAEERPRLPAAGQKRFFLKDRKGRMLGPMSSQEILALVARGRISDAVKVFKTGERSGVTLERFIAAHAAVEEQKTRAALNQHASSTPLSHQAGSLPSTRVLEELSRIAAIKDLKESNQSTALITAGLSLFLLLAIVIAWQIGLLPQPIHDRMERIGRMLRSSPSAPLANSERFEFNEPPRAVPPIEARIPANSGDTLSTDIKTITSQPKTTGSMPPSVLKTPPSKEKKTTKKTSRVDSSSRNRAPTRASPVPSNQNFKQNIRQNSPPSQAAPAPITIASLASKTGEVVTTGFLNFSPPQLQRCPAKCSLAFFDASGQKLNVIFFKGAHEKALMSTAGKTRLRGRLSDGLTSLDLYLEAVVP